MRLEDICEVCCEMQALYAQPKAQYVNVRREAQVLCLPLLSTLCPPIHLIFFIPWGLQSVQDPYEAPIGGTVCPARLTILPEYEWLC